MRITIKTCQSNAIRMGRNSTEWTTEIDVTTLTQKQREHLASINNLIDLCDATGEITVASIQAHLDSQKEKMRLERAKYEDDLGKTISRCEAAVEAYEAGGNRPTISFGALSSDYVSIIRYRIEIEDKRRVDAWETAIAPEVAAYLEGGPREFPSWVGRWAGTDETLGAIQAEDKRRNEQAKIDSDQRKIEQLTEVVNRLGTDVQREKWAARLMAHSEALDLLWHETFPGESLPGDEYHLDKIEGYRREESEKSTLTDEQFVAAKKIIATVPGATVSYYHEYYKDADDDMDSIDIVRLTKTIGEYELEADYVL